MMLGTFAIAETAIASVSPLYHIQGLDVRSYSISGKNLVGYTNLGLASIEVNGVDLDSMVGADSNWGEDGSETGTWTSPDGLSESWTAEAALSNTWTSEGEL